jgi:CRISPR-associated protein Csd1
MHRFSDRPYSTWLTIEKSLQPYKARLQSKSPGFLAWITGLLDQVHCQFRVEDYIDDRPLSGEYLLGYHCQRNGLRQAPDKPEDHDGEADKSNT